MKSIYYLILVGIVMIVSGCSSSKKITANEYVKESVWANFSPSELNQERGVVINSIYFTENDRYIKKTGVGQDSEVVLTPVFTEYGTYTCAGSLKKGIIISLQPETSIIGNVEKKEGVITQDGMILVVPDNSESIYFKLETAK